MKSSLWICTSPLAAHHRSLLAWFNSSKNRPGPHSILTSEMSSERKWEFFPSLCWFVSINRGLINVLHQKKECAKVQELQERQLKCSEVCPAAAGYSSHDCSLVVIYSKVRFLMSGASNIFCLQGIWQSKKQLSQESTEALTELWWPMPSLQLPAQAHPVTLALLPAGS